MEKKWILKEGKRWVDEGIITGEQLGKIASLYEEERRIPLLLPLLASLMLGVGFFSFVAANWTQFGLGVKLAILMTSLLVSYLLGDFTYRKVWRLFAFAWFGVGYSLFGASLYLIRLMYQFLWPDSLLYILWGAVGLLLLFLYRSTFLFFLTLVVVDAGQLVGLSGGQFSFLLFLYLLAGLGWLAWIDRKVSYFWGLSISFLIHSSVLLARFELDAAWFLIPLLLLFGIGREWKEGELRSAISLPAILGAILFSTIQIFGGMGEGMPSGEAILFLFVWLLLIAVIGYRIWNRGPERMVELLIFLPLSLLPQGRDFAYLLLLFLASLAYLWLGYHLKERGRIFASTFFFLYAILIGYIHMTWDLLPKELFFIIGGLLLFAVSFLLEWKRREALRNDEGKGGEKD